MERAEGSGSQRESAVLEPYMKEKMTKGEVNENIKFV
jgi:hypothetical protein